MSKIARRQRLLISAALFVVILRGFVPPGFMPSSGHVPLMICPDGMVMPQHGGGHHATVEHCPFGSAGLFAPLIPTISVHEVGRLEYSPLFVPAPPSAIPALLHRPQARGPPRTPA